MHKLAIRIRFFIFLTGFGILIIGSQSCYYDNEEDLYPLQAECDTLNVTYSQTISEIMSSNCNSCHSGSAPSGNIRTDSYNDLKIIADDGRLWGTVNHETGYSRMPKDRPKLNDCDLKKISIWLENGALND